MGDMAIVRLRFIFSVTNFYLIYFKFTFTKNAQKVFGFATNPIAENSRYWKIYLLRWTILLASGSRTWRRATRTTVWSWPWMAGIINWFSMAIINFLQFFVLGGHPLS